MAASQKQSSSVDPHSSPSMSTAITASIAQKENFADQEPVHLTGDASVVLARAKQAKHAVDDRLPANRF